MNVFHSSPQITVINYHLRINFFFFFLWMSASGYPSFVKNLMTSLCFFSSIVKQHLKKSEPVSAMLYHVNTLSLLVSKRYISIHSFTENDKINHFQKEKKWFIPRDEELLSFTLFICWLLSSFLLLISHHFRHCVLLPLSGAYRSR